MPKRKIIGLPFPVIAVAVGVLLILFIIGLASGPLGINILTKAFGESGVPGWLTAISVPQPHPELPAEVIFHISGFPITNTIIAAWVTIIVLVGLSYMITRRIKLVPGRLQVAFEFLLGWLYDFCRSAAGEENGRRFFPVVTTIFLFVAFNAWLGLLPGYGSITIHTAEGEAYLLRPANTDINMPLAIAVMAVVFVQYFGFKTLGPRYMGKFANVGGFFKSAGQVFKGHLGAGLSGMFTGVIQIFIGVLELLSELIHVVSFTARLFGNMTAGEILLLVAVFLVPWLFALPFYGLELLIGFLQALIFSGLTLIFLTLAVVSHGEESHESGH